MLLDVIDLRDNNVSTLNVIFSSSLADKTIKAHTPI